MFANLTHKVLFTAVATIAALSANHVTRASEPELVIRTFGFLVPASLNQQIPDFLGDDSLAVSVRPMLSEEEPLFLFDYFGTYDETLWVPHSAQHILSNRTTFEGKFYWLMTPATPTPPPVGSFTLTGPDGFICSQEFYLIDHCNSTECGIGNELEPMLANYLGAGVGDVFVVVTAVFSR